MRKFIYIVGGILLLFIITNPSASAFKEYIGTNSYSGLKGTNQFFICSVNKHSGDNYFGILGIFFRLVKNKPNTNFIDIERVADSAKAADSAKMSDSSQMKPDTLPSLPKGYINTRNTRTGYQY